MFYVKITHDYYGCAALFMSCAVIVISAGMCCWDGVVTLKLLFCCLAHIVVAG